MIVASTSTPECELPRMVSGSIRSPIITEIPKAISAGTMIFVFCAVCSCRKPVRVLKGNTSMVAPIRIAVGQVKQLMTQRMYKGTVRFLI